MRHQKNKNSSFGRHRGPRKALVRGLVQNLVEKERIKTTLPKAKCVRPLVEKAVTMGKRDNIHSRRLLFSRYPNKNTVDKILSVLSPRFKDRPGGYTRIIKLGFRAGDKAPLAYIEFVDYNNQTRKLKEPKTEPITQIDSELALKSRYAVPKVLLDNNFNFRFPQWKNATEDLFIGWKKTKQ